MLWPSVNKMPDLSGHQKIEVGKALSGLVGVLAGTPGTGKTYTAAAVIRAVVEEFGEHQVAVCAPTGKAAVRCTEAMSDYDLPIEATTIHRMLGVTKNGYDGKGWGFKYCSSNPLPFQFIFIDEASMLDIDTAACLFSAMATGTHVMFIGDPYQLPPVGHGAPLRDMIAAQLPYGELTELQRNSGDGVLLCRDLKNGKRFWASERIDIDNGLNVKLVHSTSAVQTVAHMQNLVKSPPPGIDPVWDIQVVVAVNEKSELGRKKLNVLLQDILNLHGEQSQNENGKPFHRFRVGDKVICTSNTMLPLVENGEDIVEEPKTVFDDDGDEIEVKEFVANGEIGRVLSVEPKIMTVHFDSPRRTVKVPMGAPSGSTGNGGNDSEGCKFDLGYAITTHKAQGSQMPVVIIIADEYGGANFVCSREWWYTALSRFETLTIVIGKKATIDRHCQKVSLEDRKTFLTEMLTNAV